MEEHYWKSLKIHGKIFWNAICQDERMRGLNEIKSCIDNFGFIEDYHFFSDLATSMTIAIEEKKVNLLYHALSKIITLSEFKVPDSNSASERNIMLNITFAKGTGDLKVEVPEVPG